jgi:adenylylsulfate kinase
MSVHPGFTLWFTGLSGAGKSTVALGVRDALIERGQRVEILDGDEVRRTLCQGLAFSKEDRDANVRRIGFVASLLARNGVIAIVAAISPYRETRNEVRRQHESPFVEVFVECPITELVGRDCKGLYARALRGEIEHFTGVSDPYEPPESPEIVLRTHDQTVAESCAMVLEELSARGLLAETDRAQPSMLREGSLIADFADCLSSSTSVPARALR